MSDSKSPADIWLARLADHLKTERYNRCVAQNYSAAAKRFVDHLQTEGLLVGSVQSSDVEQYLAGLRPSRKFRDRRHRATSGLRKLHRSAIHMLLRLAHGEWPAAQTPTDGHELRHNQVVSEYDGWMGDLRGLSTETRSDRCAEAYRFLKWLRENGNKKEFAEIAVAHIDAYVRSRAKFVGRPSCKRITVNLRSFLRHLHFTGRTGRDFSTAVIGPTLYAFEGIPSALRAEDVKKVLHTTRGDRSPIGRRDYAILMLLTTYGLRAGEITTLCLEDIDWKRNRLRVCHSKTGAHSELPLLREPGDAILKYLRCGRPDTTLREVFMRSRAPYRAFACGSSLYTPIRRRLATAGVTPLGKKGPHAFRHARAVSLLRSAVPLKVIGDVLGHRSADSTAAYLKLATEDLRAVALEIPTGVST
ncbi:MAG: site-specific integrase [Steroidobacteraceae bacterium]